MKFTFTVEVEVERDEGKFASREELAEQMVAALEGADESTWYGDNDGQYSTTDWTVTEQEQPKRRAR